VSEQHAGQSGPCAGCGRWITVPATGRDAEPAAPALPSARPSTPGWIVALVLVGGIAALCLCGGGVFLVPVLERTRAAARGTECASNLNTISVAMHQYQQRYGTFPPAYVVDENGRPKHSWRALLLPFLDPGLAGQYNYDEPWDGPNNRRLAARTPSVYRCPSESPTSPSGTTSYVVIDRHGAIFDGVKASSFADITDGTSSTILVVEASEAAIPWMEPRDLRPGDTSMMMHVDDYGIDSQHPGGSYVLMADGSTHFLSSSTTAQEIEGMVTAAGGESVTLP
jgi:hypothetical protein